MRSKLIWVLAIGAVIVGGSGYLGSLWATPSAGFSASTIAVGRFGDIDVNNHGFFPESANFPGLHPGRNLWLSLQKTNGPSDLYVQNNVWALGGTSGWHTHPGHSLIIVTAGAVTAYEQDDPSCTPHTYSVGMGFVDAGGDHVHLIRNEGSVEARTIAVQFIPAGATRRIDAAASRYCPF
jgi:quercetin dioxygenase-like cupin family protein